MSFWRPFEDSEDENAHTLFESKASSKTRIRVGDKEKELIMEAYLRREDDWTAVMADVKTKVPTAMPSFDNLCQFYSKEEEKKVLRRIKRIVREETKVQAMLYQRTTQPQDANQQKPKSVHGLGAHAVSKKMRYAEKKTPEERSKRKLEYFVDSESDESADNEEAQFTILAKKQKQASLRDVNYQAQLAHTSMCEKASASLEVMNNVLKKLEAN